MEKRNILTVTLNPAIDVQYRLNELKLGRTNRTMNSLKLAGGKGINVAKVLKQLDEEVSATGFLGGANGAFIRGELKRLDIIDEFVQIKDDTRQCLAFIDSINNQTEVLEEGPSISEQEQRIFKQRISELWGTVDLITVNGSLPKAVTSEVYQWLLKEAKKHGVKVLLDTSGGSLIDCLPYSPYMIKPNHQELEQILGYECEEEEEIWLAMEEIAKNCIPLVIVSDGENGSRVLFDGKRLKVTTPKILVVNPVGSGDSFIAGFAHGLSNGKPIEDCLAIASACGAANALEEKSGHINPALLPELMAQIEVDVFC